MRILLLDNYDSFTYNLWDYLMRCAPSGTEVEVLRNDACTVEDVARGRYAAIVLSPGPRRPEHAGILLELIAAFHERLPMLGVCLGHQALGEFFGARLVRAALPMHGKTDNIRHDGTGIFADLPAEFSVMRYHSLLLQDLPPEHLQTQAWTERGECMALKHKRLPLWGLQFHPESILCEQGLRLISNWLAAAGLLPRSQP